MRERILKFLAALDAVLVSQAPEGQRLDLYVIGKAAVILFYEVSRTEQRAGCRRRYQRTIPVEFAVPAPIDEWEEGTAENSTTEANSFFE